MLSEKELTDWIKTNSLSLFGEELEWYTLPNFNADLLGRDKNGNPVIIEVKCWTDNSANRNIQEYVSVGQIIHYANVFQTQHPDTDIRLFIIAHSTSLKVVACCEYLRQYGFNIQHLSKLDALKKINEKLKKELEKHTRLKGIETRSC